MARVRRKGAKTTNKARTKELKPSEVKLFDAEWFISRLGITPKAGPVLTLGEAGFHGEQKQLLDALGNGGGNVCVLKSRQMGITTIVLAWLLWRVLTAGGPFNVLTVTHEHRAVGRVNRILKQMLKSLPRPIRPKILANNSSEICISFAGHVSWFRQTMAGGRDQGRSQSYRAIHFTEGAFYPKGSSAKAGSQLDTDMVESAMSTLPPPNLDPLRTVIHESTADGPTGMFYEVVNNASNSKAWSFLFFPWYLFRDYALPIGDDFVLTDEEAELLDAVPEMTEENIAFRRYKLTVENYSPTRFRKEYPTTKAEPFLVTGAMWFDTEVLNAIQMTIPPVAWKHKSGARRYLKYEKHRRYFAGYDASGGTGRDNAVLVIVRDDLAVAAVWSSNRDQPYQQGEKAGALAKEYHAGVLVECGNRWGNAVKKRMVQLEVKMHEIEDEHGKVKDFVTDTRTKLRVLDWSKAVVDSGKVAINDPMILEEALIIREQNDGTIQADAGFHDDHVMGLGLALWAARRVYSTGKTATLTPEQRQQRVEDWMGTT